MDIATLPTEKNEIGFKKILLYFSVLTLLCVGSALFVYHSLNTPPSDFPIETKVTITEGLTINAITEKLAQEHVVSSSLLLYTTLLYHFKDTYVQAGVYTFDKPLNVKEVAEAITSGSHRSPLVSVTLPEGFRARDISTYTRDKISIPSPDLFIPYEGFLFPDTYDISTDISPEEFLTLLTKTSESKLATYTNAITESGFTKTEIIVLASIIEREAKDLQSKRIVSGILRNRLSADMPLQVDATFDYILNKTSNELTMDDLSIDSPYNTYTHRGLPPTPIANPGIESIEAVLYPEKSEYMYYLTAPDGTFHYAKTFEEHKRNKEEFLR